MQLKILQTTMKNFLQDKAAAPLAVTPICGLNIYKQNYFKSLTAAMENKYPVACAFLKESRQKLFYDFIAVYPSTSPNLNDYGAEFVSYLTHNNYAIAASLARIDLEVFTSLQCYDEPISPNELAHIIPYDFDRLTLLLNPALQLIKINSKDLLLWEELNKGQQPTICKGLDRLQEACVFVAICQVDNMVVFNVIPSIYYQCFAIIRNNTNLLETMAKALEVDLNFNLNDFLTFCFKNNLITGYNLAS